MIETTTSDAVLARLEALAARLDGLESGSSALYADNARLMAARPADARPAPEPSAAPQRGGQRPAGSGALKRRGLLAGVMLATAGLLTRTGERVAQAAPITGDSGSSNTPGVTAVNTTTGIALAAVSGQPSPPGLGGPQPVLYAFNNNSNQKAIRGGAVGAQSIGVEGAGGTGVFGLSNSGGGGVQGTSSGSAGIFGVGPIGVYAAGSGVAGVFGGSNGNGFGFWGSSVTSAGIYGTSTSGPGVRAESTNHWGLHAKSPTHAGVFEGNVFVSGQVVALGGFGASAATTTTRTLAEDVGEATLTNGKATVALEPAFAEEVKGSPYQVFVTPHDASGRVLAVVARRRDGFDVQELAGGTTETGGAPGRGSNAGSSYRVVAKLPGPGGPRQAPLAPPDLTTIKPAPPLPQPPKTAEPSEERRER